MRTFRWHFIHIANFKTYGYQTRSENYISNFPKRGHCAQIHSNNTNLWTNWAHFFLSFFNLFRENLGERDSSWQNRKFVWILNSRKWQHCPTSIYRVILHSLAKSSSGGIFLDERRCFSIKYTLASCKSDNYKIKSLLFRLNFAQ